ncbi:MAG: ADP-ribosylglycohydrolase family protein [Candidatus Limnocylindrales bacterium]
MTDRLRAAVYGHLVGDAIGVPYEFGHHIQSVELRGHGSHDQPPGTWSDDGALLLAVVDSLLAVGFDPEDQGRRALAWAEVGAYTPDGAARGRCRVNGWPTERFSPHAVPQIRVPAPRAYRPLIGRIPPVGSPGEETPAVCRTAQLTTKMRVVSARICHPAQLRDGFGSISAGLGPKVVVSCAGAQMGAVRQRANGSASV